MIVKIVSAIGGEVLEFDVDPESGIENIKSQVAKKKKSTCLNSNSGVQRPATRKRYNTRKSWRSALRQIIPCYPN